MNKVDCRSALYMPASNERALAKGATLAADAIIVDLEDSVAPDTKTAARAMAIRALSEQDYGYRLRALRINTADTEWFADDVAAALAARPDAVVLPKVETVADIARLSAALDANDDADDIAIWAMMESPLAVLNARDLALCSGQFPRLAMFLIGNNDLARAADMTISSDRSLLLPWLMNLVAAAKACSLNILDGVYNNFKDLDGFKVECEQGYSMGMDGKTLIHPSQIEIANASYSPSRQAIQRAQVVVDAFARPENANVGVLQIDGRMTERLHLHMAEELLARVARLAQRS